MIAADDDGTITFNPRRRTKVNNIFNDQKENCQMDSINVLPEKTSSLESAKKSSNERALQPLDSNTKSDAVMLTDGVNQRTGLHDTPVKGGPTSALSNPETPFRRQLNDLSDNLDAVLSLSSDGEPQRTRSTPTPFQPEPTASANSNKLVYSPIFKFKSGQQWDPHREETTVPTEAEAPLVEHDATSATDNGSACGSTPLTDVNAIHTDTACDSTPLADANLSTDTGVACGSTPLMEESPAEVPLETGAIESVASGDVIESAWAGYVAASDVNESVAAGDVAAGDVNESIAAGDDDATDANSPASVASDPIVESPAAGDLDSYPANDDQEGMPSAPVDEPVGHSSVSPASQAVHTPDADPEPLLPEESPSADTTPCADSENGGAVDTCASLSGPSGIDGASNPGVPQLSTSEITNAASASETTHGAAPATVDVDGPTSDEKEINAADAVAATVDGPTSYEKESNAADAVAATVDGPTSDEKESNAADAVAVDTAFLTEPTSESVSVESCANNSSATQKNLDEVEMPTVAATASASEECVVPDPVASDATENAAKVPGSGDAVPQCVNSEGPPEAALSDTRGLQGAGKTAVRAEWDAERKTLQQKVAVLEQSVTSHEENLVQKEKVLVETKEELLTARAELERVQETTGQKIKEYQGVVAEFTPMLDQFQAEREKLQGERDLLHEDAVKLREETSKTTAENARLMDKVASLERARDDAMKEASVLHERVAELEKRAADDAQRRLVYKYNDEDLSEAREKARADAVQASEARGSKETELLQAELDRVSKEVHVSETERQRLSAIVEDYAETMDRVLNNKWEGSLIRMRTLERENERLKGDLLHALDSNDALMKKYEAAKATVEEVRINEKKALEIARARVATMDALQERHRDMQEDFSGKVNTLEQDLKNSREETARVSNELSSTKSIMSALEESLKRTEGNMERKEETLNQRVKELEKSLEESQLLLREEEKKRAESEKSAQTHSQEHSKLTASLEKEESLTRSLKARVYDLQSTIDELRSHGSSGEASAQLTDEITTLRREKQELEHVAVDAINKYEDLNKKYRALQSQAGEL